MGEEKFSVLTQLYMQLRRNGGRKIDVVWAMQNAEYAREVLRLARASGDDTARKLASRLDTLGLTNTPQSDAVVPTEEPKPSADSSNVAKSKLGKRQYIDTLR